MTAAPAPLLALSMGDPAGIGPEVIAKAASVRDVRATAGLVVYGDVFVLERAARECGVRIRIIPVENDEEAREIRDPELLAVVPVSRLSASTHNWGAPTADSDRGQGDYIFRALEAVTKGEADGLVTAPISKAALRRAGLDWPGHTEMLAHFTGVTRPMMMLAGPTLKVVPLTTHVALADVPRLLTIELLQHALRVTNDALRRHFRRFRPRIAVAGLNPHAGEGGLFGREELDVLVPAIEAAREEGIDAQGPFPGDTIFHRAVSGEFDVVIGMYHDQALIPLKLLDFDHAVNVTLGLPIIRTSVDHGTAYDIAGRGIGSASSMIAAIRLAADMAKKSRADSDAQDPETDLMDRIELEGGASMPAEGQDAVVVEGGDPKPSTA